MNVSDSSSRILRNRRIYYMIFNDKAKQNMLVNKKTNKSQVLFKDIFNVKPLVLNDPKKSKLDETF